MISDFYREVAGKKIDTGMIIAHQTFGDMLRFNPHFHAILLEGGFDEEGSFVYLPFSGLEKMTECFRRTVLRFFTEKKLLTKQFAQNLLSWKHSGFSIDNSVRILDESSRDNLAQYIARPPISLKKIHYEGFKGRVLFHTHYNEYFKENVHMFKACDFRAELTQHIPPKGVQLIRRYGLYSSRIKGAWESMPHWRDRSSLRCGTTLELPNVLQPAGKTSTRARQGLRNLKISKLSRIQTFQMTHQMHALTRRHGHACCRRFTR
nr:transposase [Salinispira pacifica]